MKFITVNGSEPINLDNVSAIKRDGNKLFFYRNNHRDGRSEIIVALEDEQTAKTALADIVTKAKLIIGSVSSELIDASTDFSASTGWTLGDDISIAGGKLVWSVVGIGNIAEATLDPGVEDGKNYRMTLTFGEDEITGTAKLDASVGSNSFASISYVPGQTVIAYMTAGSNEPYLNLVMTSETITGVEVATINSISIVEIDG